MKNFLLFLLFVPQVFFKDHPDNGIKNVCKYPIDEKPVVRIDDHLQGIWKMEEDSDSHNYFIVEKEDDHAYVLTYMNRSGDNRGLEHGRAYFSEINNVKFLVFPNWYREHQGYVFLKIKYISTGSWDVTASMVMDTTLYKIQNSSELRALFEKNVNNPAFYGRDLHFRKRFEFNSWR